MGLSTAVSGGIVFVVLIFVLMSIPGFMDSIFSVQDTSSEVSTLENSVRKTDMNINSLAAVSGSSKVNFTLNNIGEEKLWNFEKFDMIIVYDSSSGRLTQQFSYEGNCNRGIPSAGDWCIEEVEWDLNDPGILNIGEGAMIRTQLNQNLGTGTIIIVVSADNGVITTLSKTT